MGISEDMLNEKLKNKTSIFVAATVAIAVALCIALFNAPEQGKAEATPSNTRNLEVAIVWSDNVEAHLGQSSSVTLYQNGAAISTVTLSSPLWWYQWTGLDSAASYDVRQNSTFPNYYTEYAWDANNNVTIKNIQNGSPAPPWPTPQPEPGTWTEETIVIYGDNPDGASNSADQNNQNAEGANGNATIDNSLTSPNWNRSQDDNFLPAELIDFVSKAGIVFFIVGIILLLFFIEYRSSKKNRNE